MYLYETTYDSFGGLYRDNLISGYAFETKGLKQSAQVGIFMGIPNLFTKWSGDARIYNRKPADVWIAFGISTAGSIVDFTFGLFLPPPIGSAVSAGIYYVEQGIKECIIGY